MNINFFSKEKDQDFNSVLKTAVDKYQDFSNHQRFCVSDIDRDKERYKILKDIGLGYSADAVRLKK